MADNEKRLRRAWADRRLAERAIADALVEGWPIGAEIRWCRREVIYFGRVIQHSRDDRIKVENYTTGRKIWIGIDWILQVAGIANFAGCSDLDRRCDSNFCGAGGDCIACGAIQGEACQAPRKH